MLIRADKRTNKTKKNLAKFFFLRKEERHIAILSYNILKYYIEFPRMRRVFFVRVKKSDNSHVDVEI